MKKRYDAGGKVSDAEDTGTANARADQISAEQAVRDYGRGHTWIENRAGTINPEPRVSPLIYITPKKGYNAYAGGGGVPRLGGVAAGSRSNLGTPPSPVATDPQLPQLSSGYWDRVRRQNAMERASQPSPDEAQALDAKAQDRNAFIAPPGPQPGAAPGAAYRKGGKVAAFGFAKGGSANFGKNYSK